MEKDAAHQKKWEIIDLFVGVPMLFSILLEFGFPIGILRSTFDLWLLLPGTLSLVTGVVFIVAARKELAKFEQPTDPGLSTDRLVQSGVFAFSRNPMNLGAILFYIGLGLCLRNVWSLVFLLPVVVICANVLIKPEEKYLSAKFGIPYTEYTNRVNRWLGARKTRRNTLPSSSTRSSSNPKPSAGTSG